MTRIALIALAAALLAPLAHAGDDDVLGPWRFATLPHPASGCTISGTADFSPGVAANFYAVAIEAEEHCPDMGRTARVSERCAATRAYQSLRIRCRLVESDTPDYVPDHFRIDAVSAQLMTGRLDDERAWDVPVRFERSGADALIS